MDKTRILIVDDDASLARLVQLMLEKTKLHSAKVENRPVHALAATREFRPHLILLDVDMPGLDGGAVARQIRGDSELKGTPIIFFTSLLSQSEAGQHCIMRGGERYLAKPVDGMVLIECIEDVLAGAVSASA
ncbi:MAG: two-component system, OmpR family, response regulator [Chthoniobacter sp.]|jgi:CheY-like chemotaxis protein|nr:two-component system, OmpR family, response regulator [Chthoniobacter sp.]